ncbi:large subunit ribosomal protein L29 [Dysgonomonas hofstadii]|uniref:Large ribosomal subunit protein uL29 n=1 Tax=Dysgonomonas hofstadii TaxID=637886 RepID=A0A840CM21_9BACT|nr:50S ribosomal protein L29 [Dysgonomonas hofstadii]MBB4036426.1 large subunit ribosomal protein L29 [Dysgonomonas hofstadii]
MKIAEVRELSDKELKERLDAERIALNQMVLNHSVSPLDTPSKIKEKRRDIARFMTEIRSRELKNK